MRDGICPKCVQANVRVARGWAYWFGSSTTGQLRLRTSDRVPSTEVSSIIDTYVCVSCGYMEQYVMSAEAISAVAASWTYVPSMRGDR